MKILRYILPQIILLAIFLSKIGFAQTNTLNSGCDYGWVFRLNGELIGQNTDTIFCGVNDTVQIGVYFGTGGACPGVNSYDWYYNLRVCDDLNSYVPDSFLIGYDIPEGLSNQWFTSSTYEGDLTIHFIPAGFCRETKIVRSQTTDIEPITVNGWKIFYDPKLNQIKGNLPSNQSYSMEVYSLDGQLVTSISDARNNAPLPILASGIYIAKMIVNKTIIRKKFFIPKN